MLDRTDGRLLAGNWTDIRIADLKRLWAEGLSCSQIGGILGVSRNAVVGKINRCGFDAPAAKAAITRNRPKRQPGWKPIQWRPPMSQEERSRQMKERALLREIEKPPQHTVFLRLTLDQLERGECRYPLGDEAPYVFCGQPVLKGSYCRHCSKVVYRA